MKHKAKIIVGLPMGIVSTGLIAFLQDDVGRQWLGKWHTTTFVALICLAGVAVCLLMLSGPLQRMAGFIRRSVAAVSQIGRWGEVIQLVKGVGAGIQSLEKRVSDIEAYVRNMRAVQSPLGDSLLQLYEQVEEPTRQQRTLQRVYDIVRTMADDHNSTGSQDSELARVIERIHECVPLRSNDPALEKLVYSIRRTACALPIRTYRVTHRALRISIEKILQCCHGSLTPRQLFVYAEVMEYADLCRYADLRRFLPHLRRIRNSLDFSGMAARLGLREAVFNFGARFVPTPKNEGRIWKRVWPVVKARDREAPWGRVYCTLTNGSPCKKDCELRELSLCGASTTECTAENGAQIAAMRFKLFKEGEKKTEITVRRARFVEHSGHFSVSNGRKRRDEPGTGLDFEEVDPVEFSRLANFIRQSQELDPGNPPLNAPWMKPNEG